jgi:hypothetical protein
MKMDTIHEIYNRNYLVYIFITYEYIFLKVELS